MVQLRRSTYIVALLGVAPLVAPLGAQQARPLADTPARPSTRAAAKRPEYQTLRFEERWDAPPAGAHASDAFEPVKHLALGGPVWVTLAGQERVRAERVSHLGIGAAGTTDAFALQRLRLSADVHVGGHVRLFGEARDSRAASRDLPGGARPQDTDRWDAQNAFGELALGHFAVRVGRQELLYGKERLVSPGDWTNAPRTFQGARATFSSGLLGLDAFTTHPVLLEQGAANGPDVATRFSGALLNAGSRGTTVQLYAFDLRQRSAKFAGLTGAQRRETLGARTAGKTAARWLGYEAEGAWQTGRLAGRVIDAWFVASDLTATAASVRCKPALGVGADVASGDRDPADATSNTFNQMYPSGHSHLGYADVLGRQNVAELRVVGTAAVTSRLQARLAAHRFLRASLHDGLYTTAGASLRPAGASDERSAGAEADASAAWQLGTHLKLTAGYARFAPGAFLRTSAAGARAVDWGFATTTFTF